MKHKLTVLLGILLFVISSFFQGKSVEAYYSDDTQYMSRSLGYMEGDWYDRKGNLVLRIHDGYINDCEAVKMYNAAGGSRFASAHFVIKEGSGLRDITLSWDMINGTKNRIGFNNYVTLFRTSNPPHYESVDGVYLGMTRQEVVDLWGKPDHIGDLAPMIRGKRSGWYYGKKMIALQFTQSNCLSNIIMLNGSREKLAQSGLNCRNTPQQFAKFYNFSRIPDVSNPQHYSKGAFAIGEGEFLFFAPNMNHITLSLYTN